MDILNELREGKLTPAAIRQLKALDRPMDMANGALAPTELFPHRADVDRANSARLDRLKTKEHVFIAVDIISPNIDKEDVPVAKAGLHDIPAPRTLVLKSCAQAMLVSNLDSTRGLVNGAVGRIVTFLRVDSKTSKTAVHDPIIDAEGNVDLEAHGQLDGPHFPCVLFHTPRGAVKVIISREEFKVDNSLGKTIARRSQVPLILAWAISIHKSQGQTLQRVKVDIRRVFAEGASVGVRRRSYGTNHQSYKVTRTLPYHAPPRWKDSRFAVLNPAR